MVNKRKSTFTISNKAKLLLVEMAKEYGLSQSSMLEVIIRDRAKEEGLWDKTIITKEDAK